MDAPVPTKAKPNTALGCLVLIAVLAGLLWAGSAWYSGLRGTPANTPAIGQDGHARVDGPSGVVAAPALADLEDAFHTVENNDTVGQRALAQSGRVFTIPNGTKVHVLSAAIGRYQVRVLEGAHANEAVWIQWDALEK